jgi:hypothetical protein
MKIRSRSPNHTRAESLGLAVKVWGQYGLANLIWGLLRYLTPQAQNCTIDRGTDDRQKYRHFQLRSYVIPLHRTLAYSRAREFLPGFYRSHRRSHRVSQFCLVLYQLDGFPCQTCAVPTKNFLLSFFLSEVF